MALTRAQIQTAFQNSLGRPATANDENSFFAVSQSGALTDAQIFTTISNSQEANLAADPVVRFYQAAFGRVPDQAGLDNATDYIRAFGATAQTYQNLSNMFAQSTEFTLRFGTGTAVDAAYVQALYSTILGRQASAGEIDAFTSGANGYTTRGGVLYAISQSGEAQGISDAAVNGFLNNAAQGQAVYAGSLYTAQNGGSTGPGTGQTAALTTNVDTLTGTAGNDTFNGFVNVATGATNSTLTAADSINGGAGTDSLNITVEGAAAGFLPAANITNIENFFIREVGGTEGVYDFGQVTGEQQVWSDRSTDAVKFTNVAAGTTVGLRGDGSTVLGNVAFEQVTATSAVNIAVDGGVGASGTPPTVTNGITGGVTTNPTAATITSTGAANTLGAIDLSESTASATVGINSLTVNATTNLTATLTANDFNTGGADLKVSGAATTVNLGANGVFKTIDASGLTAGGLTVGLNALTTSFKGGAGNDIVTTAAVTGAAGSIDAGAGTGDRLIAANNITAAADGARYINFEQLQVENGVSVDASFVTGITGIRINDATGATSVTNLTAAQAANIQVIAANATGAITIGVAGATTTGQLDTVKILADDGVAATVSTIALGTPVLAGIETLEINAVDNVSVAALTSATALNRITLSGGGEISVTSGAITPQVNTVVDGSLATGKLTIDLSGVVGATTTNAVSIVGGSGADTITATGGAADLINGKAGIDAITVTKDALNSGFATVQSETTVVANADVITGFVTTENKFDYNGALSNGTGTTSNGIQSAEVQTAATLTAALADPAAANNTIVYIAQTNVADGGGNTQGAAFTALLGSTSTDLVANTNALKAQLVAAGGALGGSIANLDTVLGTGDSALVALDNGVGSVLFRITNTDTATVNTLTVNEIELVGVFTNTVALAAGDFI